MASSTCSCSGLRKFKEIVRNAIKSTVMVRFTNDPGKKVYFSTGVVIGQVQRWTIILSVGHYVQLGSTEPLEVVFHGHPNETHPCTIQLHLPRSEILIVTVEKKNEEIKPGKLIFESAKNWNLEFLQLLACISHPCGRSWRAALGIVNCPEFYNSEIKAYDDQMVLFDHSLELGVGSSGAALLNEKGHIVGIQSGQIVARYLALSAEPVLDALEFKNKQITDLSCEFAGACLAEFVFGHGHVHKVETVMCSLKQAVHVMYIDSILRHNFEKFFPNDGEVKLNDLIESYVSMRIKSRIGSLERGIYTLRESSHPHSARPAFHPYARTSSSRTSSIAFYTPQGTKLYDNASLGAEKGGDDCVYVGGWNGDQMHEPGDGGMKPKTKSDGRGDSKGKFAAAAHKWNIKERNTYGDGEKSAGEGGGAGKWKTSEEFSCSRGGFGSCSIGNALCMCGEAEYISRKCSLCLLGETYDGVGASEFVGGWVDNAEMNKPFNSGMKKPMDTLSVSDGLSNSGRKSTIVKSWETVEVNEPMDTSSVSDGLSDLVGKSTFIESWETVAAAAAHRQESKEWSKWKQGWFVHIWSKSRGRGWCWGVKHT